MSVFIHTVLVSISALLIYHLNQVGRRPPGCPPGPPTLPLLGNLHLMPKTKRHLQFQKWAEEYGPIYSLVLGTKVMIVISSSQGVKDLLDKRSGIYSSRPDMYLGQVASGRLHMLLMPYGDTWRMIRKIVHNNLNIRAARSYVPYQDLENKVMLKEMLENPDLFIDNIRRYSNSLSTQMLFGFRTIGIDDPKLKKLYHGFEKFSELMGEFTAALLDSYPIFRVLPDFMLPLRQYAKQVHADIFDLYVGHWLTAKKAIKNGTAKPCFCVDLVRAQDEERFSDGIAGYVSGSLLEAGSDTTASTLVGFVQAMLLFPEVAKMAQEELDRVCGNRLPTLDDEPNLPYIRGCVKESLRWMPTAILGVPHAVIRDDEYLGYRIPKGAGVIYNVWAIHMDPGRYPNPQRFDPIRYANDEQTAAEAATNADASQRDHFGFGAGRRLCQGMHIAERSLFLAISRLLWAFDFKMVRGKNGAEISPNAHDLTEGLVVTPKPFPARLKPRDSGKAECIKNEWSKMRDLLDDELQWKTVPEGLVWKDYQNTSTTM